MSINKTLNHIAFIMDGNRRWATEKGLPKLVGHTQGLKNLRIVAKAVKKMVIPYMTIWALSTDNLKSRSKDELGHLFALIDTLPEYLNDFLSDNVRCNVIGDLTPLPKKSQNVLMKMMQATQNNSSMTFTLAINYGGRDEILRAIHKIKEKNETMTEQTFSSFLDTHDLPDPDLIIRTGGHQRLSGFMPWQTIYSELYFTPTYWPAFTEKELDKAIEWFHQQDRKRGA